MSCIPSISPCHGSSGGTVISMIKRRSCLSVHCLPGFLSLPLSWSPDMESNRCVQWPSEACLASILQCLTAKSAHFKHLPPLSPFAIFNYTFPPYHLGNFLILPWLAWCWHGRRPEWQMKAWGLGMLERWKTWTGGSQLHRFLSHVFWILRMATCGSRLLSVHAGYVLHRGWCSVYIQGRHLGPDIHDQTNTELRHNIATLVHVSVLENG